MAPSQVAIATSSPFGCVLTKHNRRDACTTTHANATLQKNVPISSDSAPNQNNAQKPIISNNNNNNADNNIWVSKVAKRNKNLGSLSVTRRLHNNKDHDSSLSALVSPRHSRIIDRWAARQAREVAMTTTLEKNNEVEAEVLENFSTSRRNASVSPPRSDASSSSGGSSEVSILGASSLVQIWEKRLNQSKSNNAPPPPTTPGRSTSTDHASCNVENNECSVVEEEVEQCRVSELEGESSVEQPQQGNEEPFHDWESDKTRSPSDQSCCSSKDAAAERERVRVADIIKRLTVTNQMQSPVCVSDDNDHHELSSNSVVTGSAYRERDRTASVPKQAEHKAFGFGQVISSPRVRGRQAFTDLIMQFESDRHGELNNLEQRGAVSKFTQRGRIQSLLRLRLLKRGVAAAAASEANKQQEGSAIMQLRERFNTGEEQRTSSPAEVSDPRSVGREIGSSTTQLDNLPTSNQLSKDTGCNIVTGIQFKTHTQHSVSQTSAFNKEEAHPSSDNDGLKETVGASSSTADSYANETTDKVEARDQQHDTAETSHEEIVEEEEASEQNCDGEGRVSYDWTSDISRPRSYWVERRQEWYKEMLDFGSDNNEIRKLLERRTVSTVLSSDFRKRMDRLMKSHVGAQTHLASNQYDEGDQEESMEQLMAFYHDRLRVRDSPPEDGRDEEEVRRNEEEKAEEQEEESIISGSDYELGDYHSSSSIHTPSSSTWSYRDNDGGDDPDRVASVSSPIPSQSQSFYQDSQQDTSSTNHHSIEMEFIYDLRGQMNQLFHEMSELRKSIKTCVDMQMQMQQSKNQEVHTVKQAEKKFHNKTPKRGNCCICHDKKVNSVLYRCGHMCACLKCANELQWNSGKCPICGAPIIDVVRVYTDTQSYIDGQSLAVED